MNDLSNLFKGANSELGLNEFMISLLFSLVAGIICMFLYRLYFSRAYDRNASLNRSFVIIAPSISAVFWAIQYSLPLSLGLLGALSFVRFRTPIKKAEDIGFILLVIALALLSSVYRFQAACILLILITFTTLVKAALVEKQLPLINKISFLKPDTELTVFASLNSDNVEQVDKDLREAVGQKGGSLNTAKLTLHDVIQKEQGYNLRYSLYTNKYSDTLIPQIISTLNAVDGLERIEVFHGQTT